MVRRWHADPFGFLRPWNEVPALFGRSSTVNGRNLAVLHANWLILLRWGWWRRKVVLLNNCAVKRFMVDILAILRAAWRYVRP
jgi:hypothetical protein